jgi:uncharacterized protein YecE (DUF72 family)
MPRPRVRVGVIGWDYPEWRGLAYPENAKRGDLLRHYAERFPIVEAATGAYGLPKTSVVESWARSTPADFEISVKAPDWLLRKKADDPDLPQAFDTMLEHLAPLADAGKLGAIVLQHHPSYHHDKRGAELAAFVAKLPRGPRWAVELRHASWWRDETYDMLREAGVTLVWSALADGFRTPPVVTNDALYLRLFGDRALTPPYDRTRRDATDELHYWADRVGDEGGRLRRVDILVSKFLEGYAPATVEKLTRMLGVEDEQRPDAGPRQTTLL